MRRIDDRRLVNGNSKVPPGKTRIRRSWCPPDDSDGGAVLAGLASLTLRTSVHCFALNNLLSFVLYKTCLLSYVLYKTVLYLI